MFGWSKDNIKHYASERGGKLLCGRACTNFGKVCSKKVGDDKPHCSVKDLGAVEEWTRDAEPDHTNNWVYYDNSAVVAARKSVDGKQMPEGAKFFCARCYTFLSQQ